MYPFPLVPIRRVLIGLAGAALVACTPPSNDPPAFGGPAEVGPATLKAAFTLQDAAPGSGLARAAAAGVSADLTFNLYSTIDRDEAVFSTTAVGLPVDAISIEIPVELQGTFFYSVTLATEDGGLYLSGDQLRDPSGELVFPEADAETLSLRYDAATDLHLSLYQQVSAGGSVAFNSDLSVQLQLTEEQQAMVGALRDAQGQAVISGCVAYGGIATARTAYGEGVFVWEALEGGMILAGETCTLEVSLEEDGAPRLRGDVSFVAPAEGGVLGLQMDLFVVDAYVDAFFDIEGMLANVTFQMDDGLTAYLDEGSWSSTLAYSLGADNGSDDALLTEMDRQGDRLIGSLFPLNPERTVYVVTLTIWDGATPILQGSGVVDFSAGGELHLTFGYELGIEINGENLTNVYFHAWLDDDASVVSGVHVDVDVTAPNGETSTEACDTGSSANYTCLLRFPPGSTVQPTYSHPGYETAVEAAFVITGIDSVSLPYVRLLSEGCEGGRPGDAELCDGLDNDCDGVADEGLMIPLFADVDQDGYGDLADQILACDAPEGYVEDATDCDDAAADAFPGADELCDARDNDCDGDADEDLMAPLYADADGDGYGDGGAEVLSCAPVAGYVANAEDCDDGAAEVFPGAAELCDDVDQDCDGGVDEGVQDTFHADVDGDGFGAEGDTILACAQPAGYLADGSDCDDTRADIGPQGEEVCDGLDQDCDGAVDEGVLTAFHADLDGDGYGDPELMTEACEAPLGFLSDLSDCDDSDPSHHPGAAETCDGVDEDCDGRIDEGAQSEFFADADGDGHGDAGAMTLSCALPEGHVALGDDCDDADAGVSPSAEEVCNGVDEDCDGSIDEGSRTAFYADADGDGFGDAGNVRDRCEAPEGYITDNSDCDDANLEVHPGAEESCNQTDDDCDGQVDEGVQILTYRDNDADGYGDASNSRYRCEAGGSWAATPGDCDDSVAAVNPGATEACDALDNDCDDLTDEGVTTRYLRDGDGDGYGTSQSEWWACTTPNGYTTQGGDCDDARAEVNPEGIEVCDDEDLDQDCDGGADDQDPEGAEGTTLWYEDLDGDGYGAPGSDLFSCDSPVGEGSLSDDDSDCDDADAEVNPAAIEVCGDDVDNDCDGRGCLFGDLETTSATARTIGERGPDRAGFDLAYGDFNGDGYSDLLVPSYRHNQAGTNAGSVYVLYGPDISGDISLWDADAEILAENAQDNAGYAVANAGDVNGDGIDDILIGAPFADANGVDSGAAYLVYGPVSGTVSLSSVGHRMKGENEGDRAGWSVSGAGDVNGDGYDDVLVGATYHDAGGESAGAAYLVLGPIAGETPLSGADARILGDTAWDQMGFTLKGAGDLNNDGFGDFIVAANKDDTGEFNGGTVFIVHGPVTGDIPLASTVQLWGGSEDYAGRSLAAGADLNGDGYDDLVIGAFFESPGTTVDEAAWIVYGPIESSMSLNDADVVISGDSAYYRNKSYVSIVEDVNGDGLPDLLLGLHNDKDGDFFGAAYLFTETLTQDTSVTHAQATVVGANIRDYLGCAVSSAGDVDGDGFGDILIGAWGLDAGGSDAGGAYLFLGGL